MDVTKIEPLDAAGRRALLTPRPGIIVKDVPSLVAVITTGPRLLIEARDASSGERLLHSDQYVQFSMTGGDVLWVDCGGPYERRSAEYSSKDAGFCDDEMPCLLSDPLGKTATLTLQCVKRR
jgi:hypothetical protein